MFEIIGKAVDKVVCKVIGDTVFVCVCTKVLLIDPIKEKIF